MIAFRTHLSGRLAVAAVLSLVGPAVGCTGSHTADDANIGSVNSATIGQTGGSIEVLGATLTIPPGALERDTRITVSVTTEPIPMGYVGMSPVYRYEPAGTMFRHPVEVRLPFAGEPSLAQFQWSDSAGYEQIPAVVSGSSISALVTHFSTGFVGYRTTDSSADAADAAIDATYDALIDSNPLDVGDGASSDADASVPIDVGDDHVACGGCAAHPTRPFSSSRVTTHRPTLRWQLPSGADGGHVELCTDRALTASCATFDVSGTSVRPAADLSVGMWYWRVTATRGGVRDSIPGPTWEFRVVRENVAIDATSGFFTDVNGDGFEDVVAGAALPCTFPMQGNPALYVYLGSAAGLSATPSIVRAIVAFPPSYYAYRVAAIDVDGDGYTDVLVANPEAASGVGEVLLYLGGPTGLATAPMTLVAPPGAANFGTVLTAMGDVDADGFGDFAGSGCTYALSTACSSDTWVFHGGDSISAIVPRESFRATASAAPELTPAGDVNADGFADVVVTLTDAELRLGSASGISSTSAMTFAPGTTGPSTVAGIGDVNGDGYGDIGVATGLNTNMSAVSIYLGGAGGIAATPALRISPPDWHYFSGGMNSDLGRLMAPAGDTNGDGYDDFLVSNFSTPVYLAYVFQGSASGGSPTPTARMTYRAGALRGGGDFDGDGFDDVLVGATDVCMSGVAVYLGSASGTPSTPSLTLQRESTTSQSGFGSTLACSDRSGSNNGRWTDGARATWLRSASRLGVTASL